MANNKLLNPCVCHECAMELKRLRERNERLSGGLNGAIVDFHTIEKAKDTITGDKLSLKQIQNLAWRMRLYLQEILG